MTELQQILHLISNDLPAAGIDSLLIGGFAVNHYGYTRNTLDIDFMVATAQINTVRSIMQRAGFINIESLENVMFFSKPDQTLRVDFLKTNADTMRTLLARANSISVHGFPLRVPMLKDLLAMKIHALTQDPVRRRAKDLPDIAFLTLMNGLGNDIQQLCEAFGTPEIGRMIHEQIEGLRE